MITIYHYTDPDNVEKILKEGLRAASSYENFTSLRSNVVYCWLRTKDNKLYSGDSVSLEITVDESYCLIADMEWVSLAMMFKYGKKVSSQ